MTLTPLINISNCVNRRQSGIARRGHASDHTENGGKADWSAKESLEKVIRRPRQPEARCPRPPQKITDLRWISHLLTCWPGKTDLEDLATDLLIVVSAVAPTVLQPTEATTAKKG
jgi:hypothetical protein